jgi:predicted CopG family antitoxin
MKMTTIQIEEKLKKELDKRKTHPRESYNDVLKRMLEDEEVFTLEDAFKLADSVKEQKKYSTKEVIELTHELRKRR